MKLEKNDYVLYDKENDKMVSFVFNNDVVIYGNRKEALQDRRGQEEIVSCLKLTKKNQNILLEQINNC